MYLLHLARFFAGMMMRGSDFSHRAAEESLPLREAFAVLFFVSIGMLFDPMVLVTHPLQVLAVVGIIIFGKTIVSILLVLAFRYPFNTALIVSISLAQIGEFSFILAGLGVSLELLPIAGQNLILAGAIISIAINSLLFKIIYPLQTWINSRSAITKRLEAQSNPLTELSALSTQNYLSEQVVLVGYGRVGRRIIKILHKNRIPFVAVEKNPEFTKSLRTKKILAVCGDASESEVLIQAHIAHAGILVIASPNAYATLQMIKIARALNPKIEVLARTHSEEESKLLMQENIIKVFLGEDELGKIMGEQALKRYRKTLS